MDGSRASCGEGCLDRVAAGLIPTLFVLAASFGECENRANPMKEVNGTSLSPMNFGIVLVSPFFEVSHSCTVASTVMDFCGGTTPQATPSDGS